METMSNLAIAKYNKIYTLICNDRVGWNSIYIMIEWAIKLKDFCNQYSYKIFKSVDESDQSTIPDKLQAKNQELLIEIKTILTVFF